MVVLPLFVSAARRRQRAQYVTLDALSTVATIFLLRPVLFRRRRRGGLDASGDDVGADEVREVGGHGPERRTTARSIA
jgi:hypothetical protein